MSSIDAKERALPLALSAAAWILIIEGVGSLVSLMRAMLHGETTAEIGIIAVFLGWGLIRSYRWAYVGAGVYLGLGLIFFSIIMVLSFVFPSSFSLCDTAASASRDPLIYWMTSGAALVSFLCLYWLLSTDSVTKWFVSPDARDKGIPMGWARMNRWILAAAGILVIGVLFLHGYPDGILLKGKMNYKEARYSQAVNDFTRVIELRPDSLEAYLWRGVAYKRNYKTYPQAIADFSKVVALRPDRVDPYYHRGELYLSQRDFAKAIADFTAILQIIPDAVSAYYFRGLGYYFAHDYTKAIADFDRAVALDPRLVTAYLGRGLAYTAQGRYAQGIADFSKAIELEPDNKEAYSDRCRAFFLAHEYEKARADMQKTESLGYSVGQDVVDGLKRVSGPI